MDEEYRLVRRLSESSAPPIPARVIYGMPHRQLSGSPIPVHMTSTVPPEAHDKDNERESSISSTDNIDINVGTPSSNASSRLCQPDHARSLNPSLHQPRPQYSQTMTATTIDSSSLSYNTGPIASQFGNNSPHSEYASTIIQNNSNTHHNNYTFSLPQSTPSNHIDPNRPSASVFFSPTHQQSVQSHDCHQMSTNNGSSMNWETTLSANQQYASISGNTSGVSQETESNTNFETAKQAKSQSPQIEPNREYELKEKEQPNHVITVLINGGDAKESTKKHHSDIFDSDDDSDVLLEGDDENSNFRYDKLAWALMRPIKKRFKDDEEYETDDAEWSDWSAELDTDCS